MAEYRIVRDGYSGYEVQARRWWLPIWLQCGFCNTHPNIEIATEYARRLAQPEVIRLGNLKEPTK